MSMEEEQKAVLGSWPSKTFQRDTGREEFYGLCRQGLTSDGDNPTVPRS